MRSVSFLSMTLVMAATSILFPSAMAGGMSAKQKKLYPKGDALPNLNHPLVKKWVSEIDWSKVPKLPVTKAEYPGCPDCPKHQLGVPKNACWWTCKGCVAKDDIEICPREKSWGLTYDDGPSEDTPRLLTKLKAVNVTATFFVVGSRVLEYPQTLLAEVKAGHHIGLHTWSHGGMTSLTNEQIVAEIKWAEKIVFDVTGLKTKYWRPPYGDVDNRVREIARQLGYKTVIWTKDWDSNDWQIPDKTITNKEVFRNFKWALSTVPKLKGGVITLEHDLFTQTVNVAGPLLDMGLKKGLQPMDIARCMADPHPYQNSVIEKKPAPAAGAKKPAGAPAPSDQKPLAVPDADTPKEEDAKTPEKDDPTAITGAGKLAGANQLTWTVSSLLLVAASAILSL